MASFGKTTEFPAFFTQTSGFCSPCVIESVEKAAEVLNIQTQLDLQSGILLAVPIPNMFSEISGTINAAIDKAFEESRYDIIR